MSRTAGWVARFRRHDVLASGCGGIKVIDNHGQVIAAIKNRVRDSAGQTVMPETAIAHHIDHTLVGFDVQGRRAGGTQAVAHGGVAQVERRQYGKQMAANIGTDVVGAQFSLNQFHRGKNRPLWAAGAKARRARLDRFRDLLQRDDLFATRTSQLPGRCKR